MAKKTKGQEPSATINGVTNRDILQRLNFLYQASTYLSTTAAHRIYVDAHSNAMPSLDRDATRSAKREKRRKDRHPASIADLSRSYVTSMKIIGQKATVRMDPNIKRSICKTCNTVLIPGTTSFVRVKSSPVHGHTVSHTCIACNTPRRIPAPPVLDLSVIPRFSPSGSAFPLAIDTNDEVDNQSAMLDEMQVDPADTSIPRPSPKNKIRRTRTRQKKRPAPRPLPTFQRKGHVVFRGDEKLEDVSVSYNAPV